MISPFPHCCDIKHPAFLVHQVFQSRTIRLSDRGFRVGWCMTLLHTNRLYGKSTGISFTCRPQTTTTYIASVESHERRRHVLYPLKATRNDDTQDIGWKSRATTPCIMTVESHQQRRHVLHPLKATRSDDTCLYPLKATHEATARKGIRWRKQRDGRPPPPDRSSSIYTRSAHALVPRQYRPADIYGFEMFRLYLATECHADYILSTAA